MKILVCLLEEPSAKEMLKAVLPKVLPSNVDVRYMVFEGKQDLEKNLERRLRAWQQPKTCFLVMRDQDSGNCISIKNGLAAKIRESGKSSVSLIRVACRELESFYLGDLAAVEQGLKLKNISKLQTKSKFRTPDKLRNPVMELERITQGTYQKVQGSRRISPFLKLDGTNASVSFNALICGLQKLSSREA